ncbi:MAG TPA: guanosine monophosphate reductase [Candidatus Saccharimonadales bacterium]|jgi:IMP dehydrogenase|nr:guanosine monophosphate reductase [Candidatus Saccharimonadales bacterium]
MDHEFPLGLSYDDVLLVPQYSEINSRNDVDLSTQITPHVKLKLPLISINMTDVTGVDMAIALGKLGGIGFLPRFFPAEEQANMAAQVKKAGVFTAAAVGCREGYLERAEKLVNAGVDILTLDVAHAHMRQALDATSELKQKFGKTIDIISGVVGTENGANDLYKYGADSVRVGVGPGTICITRIVTGSGVPQITAVLNASKAAKRWKRTVLCDGGTNNSGDIVKGLAAGASAVIIGSQFAGTDEAPGKKIEKDGKYFKVYNASTSPTEKKNHMQNGGEKLGKNYTKQIEGVESMVKYSGSLSLLLEKMVANIRSGLSYSGARNIQEFWKKAQFIRITSLGKAENGIHNVILAS